jgi:hypothetical protein
MIARGANVDSLQPDRLEVKRLAWAFAISIALHLFTWGGYEGGKALGIWDRLRLPDWFKKITQIAKPPEQELAKLMANREPPLMFVEVNPSVSTAEPPKDTPYYSDKNSQAANVKSDTETGVPKISGSQEHVPKTEDVPRPDPNQLHPFKPPEPAKEEAKPKPTVSMGDLTLAKPDTIERKDPGTAERPKPRTIQEALSRQQLSRIPGQQMKQEGGVHRLALVPSLDAKATPFGAYDAAFIEAVSQRWYDLLDTRNYAGEGRGRVVLKFRLRYDGKITDIKVVESTVDTILTYLCQQAVHDPSPYEPWPGDMRRMVGADFREITFTFYYN